MLSVPCVHSTVGRSISLLISMLLRLPIVIAEDEAKNSNDHLWHYILVYILRQLNSILIQHQIALWETWKSIQKKERPNKHKKCPAPSIWHLQLAHVENIKTDHQHHLDHHTSAGDCGPRWKQIGGVASPLYNNKSLCWGVFTRVAIMFQKSRVKVNYPLLPCIALSWQRNKARTVLVQHF